jgi:hypothetical protein
MVNKKAMQATAMCSNLMAQPFVFVSDVSSNVE